MQSPQTAMSWTLVTLTLILQITTNVRAVRPNILFVLIDDLGFRDLGHLDPTFYTPTIDKLGSKGIRMDSTYTPPNCGPSRTALFSGAYSYRMGLQGNGLNTGGGGHVPFKYTILPQMLQDLGYKTHLIGKWHQGFCSWAMFPTKRGFDSFYGFLSAGQDHFKHIEHSEPPYPYDFRFNEMVDFSVAGDYSVHIYSERARTIIREHKATQSDKTPFFILLSHSAVHVPNQVPHSYVDRYCQAITDPSRRIKCGMMAAVDEGLLHIVQDLEESGMLNNTLIVFTSDNGGSQGAGSSNWPLRGGKGTLWEGGIRVPTFIYSNSRDILPKTRWTWSGLFYMTDWYNTLWGFATQRSDPRPFPGTDGFNEWKYLHEGSQTSLRKEVAYIGETRNHSYIRHGDFKLLIGQYGESLQEQGTTRDPPFQRTTPIGWYNPPSGMRQEKEPTRNSIPHTQLYNIALDPGERRNLAYLHPDIVDQLLKIMHADYWSIWRPEVPSGNYMSNPFFDSCANGVVSPGFCPEPDHAVRHKFQ